MDSHFPAQGSGGKETQKGRRKGGERGALQGGNRDPRSAHTPGLRGLEPLLSAPPVGAARHPGLRGRDAHAAADKFCPPCAVVEGNPDPAHARKREPCLQLGLEQ